MSDLAPTDLQLRLDAAEPILLREGATVQLGANEYRIVEYVARGGSGEVYRADWAGQHLAMKVFFPFYAMEQAEQLGLFGRPDILETLSTRFSFADREEEYASLSEVSHPYIVDVLASGDVTRCPPEPDLLPQLVRVPVLVRRWVEGLALLDAIEAYNLDDRQITNALLGLARALGYLHDSLQFMHCDIKPDNVLISQSSNESILIDFALYKNFSQAAAAKPDPTTFVCDWTYFPPLQSTDPLQQMLAKREGTRSELRKLAFPHLDLFQFGRLLEKVIARHASRFPPNELEYLGHLAEQLTDWEKVRTWTSADLIDRIRRLGAERMTPFGVEELGAPSSAERTIVLPPGTDVPCTPFVYDVINTRAFRRLSRIKQLALLDFVYPGAGYTRDLHLLYSYELARRLVLALYHEPLFRMHFDNRSVRQLLVVALIHDLNHFPFLHQSQELDLPGLDDIDLLETYCRIDERETRRDRGTDAALPKTLNELLADLDLDHHDRLARLIFSAPHQQESGHVEVDQIISSIVNSGVDVDKLSYLLYDSYFTGVRFGQGIDVSAVLKGATIGRVPREDAVQTPLHLAFTDRAFQALENVVLTRFWNFRAIYWHHTNRALMEMLLHVFRALYGPRQDGTKPGSVKNYIDATVWHVMSRQCCTWTSSTGGSFGNGRFFTACSKTGAALQAPLHGPRRRAGAQRD